MTCPWKIPRMFSHIRSEVHIEQSGWLILHWLEQLLSWGGGSVGVIRPCFPVKMHPFWKQKVRSHRALSPRLCTRCARVVPLDQTQKLNRERKTRLLSLAVFLCGYTRLNKQVSFASSKSRHNSDFEQQLVKQVGCLEMGCECFFSFRNPFAITKSVLFLIRFQYKTLLWMSLDECTDRKKVISQKLDCDWTASLKEETDWAFIIHHSFCYFLGQRKKSESPTSKKRLVPVTTNNYSMNGCAFFKVKFHKKKMMLTIESIKQLAWLWENLNFKRCWQ